MTKKRILRIEIPEWVHPNARIIVSTLMESIAEYVPAENRDALKVKVSRCVRCGKCCRKLREFPPPFVICDENGDCKYLAEEPGEHNQTKCLLGVDRSLSCTANVHHRDCPIKYRWDYDAIKDE